jgi:hypothetical protein
MKAGGTSIILTQTARGCWARTIHTRIFFPLFFFGTGSLSSVHAVLADMHYA